MVEATGTIFNEYTSEYDELLRRTIFYVPPHVPPSIFVGFGAGSISVSDEIRIFGYHKNYRSATDSRGPHECFELIGRRAVESNCECLPLSRQCSVA